MFSIEENFHFSRKVFNKAYIYLLIKDYCMSEEKTKPSEKFLEKWASIFNVIGHPMRLAILVILHGSEYTEHTDYCGMNCLRLNQIMEIMNFAPESKETVIYHLNKLIEAKLVTKIPIKTKSGEWDIRPYYKVTDNWIKSASELGIANIVENYFKNPPQAK